MAVTAQTGTLQAQPVSTLVDGRTGKIEFESITPSHYPALVRRADSPKATAHGVLSLPKGAATAPAMVLAHGSGGVSDAREDRWAEHLNDLGIAAFVVDSFNPRGIKDTAHDQSVLSPAANVADALAALRLLATHPRIDPQRIGVMGFSRGGQVAIYTALEPIRRGVIDNDLRFVVHVPFYPPCNTIYVAEKVTGAPIRFMLGGADDYTPASYCARYVEWFRSKGVAADSITYDHAHHGFDGSGRVVFINSLQTARNCDARHDLDRNVTTRLDTNEALRGPDQIREYYRGCISRGATVGPDHRAREKAAADLAAYLKKVFKL
ncbi:MAG TPA: dienelactone hydrolase family protein [Alphaproteobacteria bacterium]|nr:dienelactone hydrolase family protein [Alphaproteobacteria bacterium]